MQKKRIDTTVYVTECKHRIEHCLLQYIINGNYMGYIAIDI